MATGESMEGSGGREKKGGPLSIRSVLEGDLTSLERRQ